MRTAVTEIDAGECAEHTAVGVEQGRERPCGLRLNYKQRADKVVVAAGGAFALSVSPGWTALRVR